MSGAVEGQTVQREEQHDHPVPTDLPVVVSILSPKKKNVKMTYINRYNTHLKIL